MYAQAIQTTFKTIVGATVILFSSLVSAQIDTQTLFQRLSGIPLKKNDPRYHQIESLLNAGKAQEAARIATEGSAFYQNTIRYLATEMSNRSESPLEPLNDFVALFVGVVRDDLDARELLKGDFRYEAKKSFGLSPINNLNNNHFEEFETKGLDLKTDLKQVSPQWPNFKGAGLLTTRAWANAHYLAGTNRRAVEYSFREFMCSPIANWKTPGLPEFHVRRDVDRSPGGDPNRYHSECRTCHAALDGMAGAFANYDFKGETFISQKGWVAPKYNQNAGVFTKGYETKNNSWINLLSNPAHQETFGWRSALEGSGALSFGRMLSESRAFSRCLVKRVFQKVCRRELIASEDKFLDESTEDFEKGGYSLRTLFEKVAVSDNCIKDGVL